MNILAIETTCDDTSVAIVNSSNKVLSHILSSQVFEHNKTGGVVPEVAARKHAENMVSVIEKAVKGSGIDKDNIDYITVSYAPGLINSTLIGVTAAQILGFSWNKPVLPVHHIYCHLASTWLERDNTDFHFPILILTVSGGHNDLILMKGYCDIEILGSTLDDSAGEAFDKVARMLGLSYPGGPPIEKQAALFKEGEFIKFPIAKTKGKYDFSFSGLKTAVKLYIQKEKEVDQNIPLIAYSFQEAIFNALIKKMEKAFDEYNIKEIHLVGGVSANKCLREKINNLFDGVEFKSPKKMIYCTDNAAMIGAGAYHYLKKFGKKRFEVINPTSKDTIFDSFKLWEAQD